MTLFGIVSSSSAALPVDSLSPNLTNRYLTAAVLLAVFNGGCSGSNTAQTASGFGGTSAVAQGGTTSAGGTIAGSTASSTQGAGGGSLAMGGSANAGGTSAATGASLARGGSVATGGDQAAGGKQTTGGTSATGGNVATGGTKTSGGSKAAGGSSVTGGTVATGGTTSAAGASATGAGGTTGGSSSAGGGSSTTNTHMYTQGSDLYTHCGEKVLLRGINQMSVWTDPTASSYPAIASFGTNAIRIVYNEAGSAGGLDTLLTAAETNKMIPMPEIHDATGNFTGVAAAVNWWVQSAVVDVIKKHEKWTLLNIANEAGDNNVSNSTFQSTYTSAITTLRKAGIAVPIVIDGTGWGQNVEQLLSAAPALLAADPQKNVIFSWHEYTGGTSENSRITTNLEKSKTLGVVLINGEFASGGAGSCTENIPYSFLLAEAQRVGTGWFAWSWDTSNSDCKTNGNSLFNMTSSLTSASGLVAGWPTNVVLNDANSIKKTSIRHCEWK